MHLTFREAAGAVTVEPAFAPMLDQNLGENAARRVTGAEKQHVVNALRGHIAPVLYGLRASTMAEAM